MLDRLVVKFLVLKMWLADEHGQDVMEYALLSGGIALAIAAVLLVAPIRTAMGNFATGIGHCVDFTASPYACP